MVLWHTITRNKEQPYCYVYSLKTFLSSLKMAGVESTGSVWPCMSWNPHTHTRTHNHTHTSQSNALYIHMPIKLRTGSETTALYHSNLITRCRNKSSPTPIPRLYLVTEASHFQSSQTPLINPHRNPRYTPLSATISRRSVQNKNPRKKQHPDNTINLR